MVDPNRKINRLTEKDIEFLDECDEEYGFRFTEDDEEFMEHCVAPLMDPPVVDNWGYGGGGHNSRNHYNSNDVANKNNRGWNRRGGGEWGNRSYRNNYRRPYDRKRGRETDGGDLRYDRNRNDRPPMNIRRDYGNFVPASKD